MHAVELIAFRPFEDSHMYFFYPESLARPCDIFVGVKAMRIVAKGEHPSYRRTECPRKIDPYFENRQETCLDSKTPMRVQGVLLCVLIGLKPRSHNHNLSQVNSVKLSEVKRIPNGFSPCSLKTSGGAEVVWRMAHGPLNRSSALVNPQYTLFK
jgi:hypothetical protein